MDKNNTCFPSELLTLWMVDVSQITWDMTLNWLTYISDWHTLLDHSTLLEKSQTHDSKKSDEIALVVRRTQSDVRWRSDDLVPHRWFRTIWQMSMNGLTDGYDCCTLRVSAVSRSWCGTGHRNTLLMDVEHLCDRLWCNTRVPVITAQTTVQSSQLLSRHSTVTDLGDGDMFSVTCNVIKVSYLVSRHIRVDHRPHLTVQETVYTMWLTLKTVTRQYSQTVCYRLLKQFLPLYDCLTSFKWVTGQDKMVTGDLRQMSHCHTTSHEGCNVTNETYFSHEIPRQKIWRTK